MHRCSATCCDNKTSSLDEVNECLRNCAAKLNKAQTLVESELENCRDRIQRCVMACNDNIRAKITPDSTQTEVRTEIVKEYYSNDIYFQIDEFVEMFEACSKRCVDRQFHFMPVLLNQLKSTLRKTTK